MIQHPTSAVPTASAVPSGNLAAWLTDPRSDTYFGRTWSIRADVLAYLITGNGTLEGIAQRFGVSRQYIHKHVKRAKQIWCKPRG